MDDLNQLSDDLRSIQVEPNRYRPLLLDRMFMRATEWGTPSVKHVVERPASPPRIPMIYPLPLLGASQDARSPLSALFEYPELVPHVLKSFERPAELATLCRVNRMFCEIARKKLYKRIWVRPWEAHCDEKLLLLFRTLQGSSELCSLIRHLDVRFFPLAAKDTERYELDDRVNAAFEKMVNLEYLAWTRDKSLNPDLVKILVSLKHLKTLEISGHSRWYYDPSLLGQSESLEDLRVMMPDQTFRDALRGVLKRLGERSQGGLRGLAVIARTSPLVDDVLLKDVAESLKELRRLTLWGCTRASREGVYRIIREAENLEELSVDASPHTNLFNWSEAPDLSNMTALSLTFTPPPFTPLHSHFTTSDLPILPIASNLTSLLLTLSSDRALFPPDGLAAVSQQVDFSKLTRLSIMNLFCDADTLSNLLSMAPCLEELYISLKGDYVARESTLAGGRAGGDLRILHINAPERWSPSVDDLATLARGLPLLEQVGTGNRVYEVHRRYVGDERVVQLYRWSKTFTPGYFQNWRG